MTRGIRIFRSILLSALAVVLFAVANHWIKSELIDRENHLESLKGRISTEENRIMVLEADLAYLTRPERIDRLARDRLNFVPLEPLRILSLDAINPGGAGDSGDSSDSGGLTTPARAVSGLLHIIKGGT